MASDFRGLLIADYNHALNNCDTGNYKTLIQKDKEIIGLVKRKSNATKELFPSPYDLTKIKIDNASRAKKAKLAGGSKTSNGFYGSTKESHEKPSE